LHRCGQVAGGEVEVELPRQRDWIDGADPHEIRAEPPGTLHIALGQGGRLRPLQDGALRWEALDQHVGQAQRLGALPRGAIRIERLQPERHRLLRIAGLRCGALVRVRGDVGPAELLGDGGGAGEIVELVSREKPLDASECSRFRGAAVGRPERRGSPGADCNVEQEQCDLALRRFFERSQRPLGILMQSKRQLLARQPAAHLDIGGMAIDIGAEERHRERVADGIRGELRSIANPEVKGAQAAHRHRRECG